MLRRIWFWIGLSLLFAALLASGLDSPRAARAVSGNAPQAGGVFTVTGYLGDNTDANCCLTLREAILLTNGGTGSNGLNRALSAGEQNDVGGSCIVNGSGHITGGCGELQPDKIVFDIPIGTDIPITSGLPLISDDSTTIDGGTAAPTIDASALTVEYAGLWIDYSNAHIRHIGVKNAPTNGIVVDHSYYTTLTDVWAWGSGHQGIVIGGDGASYTTINQAYVGVGPATTACGSKANGAAGIVVVGPSIGNVIKNSVIGCNLTGVLLQSVITDSQTTTVGPGNYIGTDAAQHVLTNGFAPGVDVQELGSTIISNTIAENTPEGVLLENTFALVTGNIISANGCNGVRIAGGSNNAVGDVVSQKTGNVIEDNICYGVEVSGSGSYSNTISNNLIGDDGHANMEGGVHLGSNSHGNTVSHYFAGPNAIDHNAGPGILIDGGAHDNLIGDNSILSNAGNGIQLSGANTTGNVISQTIIAANGLDGINERNNASSNRWSQVSIFQNGGLGIDRFGGNNANNNPDEPLPVIDLALVSGPNVVVHGHVPPPTPLTNDTVELYAVNVDPSGYGEGQHYLGTGAADGTGHWTVSFPGAAVGCYTGFETVTSLLAGNPPYSGEFGPNSCRTLLPVIRR